VKRTLVINPRTDAVFVATVERESESTLDPGALQARLRAVYPNVAVRPRLLDGERVEIWYVYREGHWVPST
jgi:hypothetical protein